MKKDEVIRRLDAWLPLLLYGMLFGVAFSLPLGRVLAFLALVVFCMRAVGRREFPQVPVAGWLGFSFVVIACAVTLLGPFAARGLGKLDKLIWFFPLLLCACAIHDSSRRESAFRSFAIGVGVLSLVILVGNTTAAALAVHKAAVAGVETSFIWEVTDRGGMTDGQILMLGVLVSLHILLRPVERRRGLWMALLALQLAGLVLNLKRGSWLCTVPAAGLLIVMRGSWKRLAVLAVLAIVIALLPPVKDRMRSLRTEFGVEKGGRLAMWTQVAPELRKTYPHGLGFRCLTSELMQEAAGRRGIQVEGGRDHLHSNPIQILVALGIPGLAVWLLWMLRGLYDGLMGWLRGGNSELRMDAQCLLVMLIALLLNGLIEYNFADGEILLLYASILGMLAGCNPSTRSC